MRPDEMFTLSPTVADWPTDYTLGRPDCQSNVASCQVYHTRHLYLASNNGSKIVRGTNTMAAVRDDKLAPARTFPSEESRPFHRRRLQQRCRFLLAALQLSSGSLQGRVKSTAFEWNPESLA
jgi:hypothetical protein